MKDEQLNKVWILIRHVPHEFSEIFSVHEDKQKAINEEKKYMIKNPFIAEDLYIEEWVVEK